MTIKRIDLILKLKMFNKPTGTYIHCKDENQKCDQVRSISNRTLPGIILICFMAYGQVRANEENLIKLEIDNPILVTRDNFQDVNIRIKENSPAITSLSMDFTLNNEELKKLLYSIHDNNELGYILWKKNQVLWETVQKIEDKLINNNNNYRDYRNDYMHGLLSGHACTQPSEGDLLTLEGISEGPLKNMECDDLHYIDPIENKLDNFLYELYKNKNNLNHNQYLPLTIKMQLEELLSRFDIESARDEKYRLYPKNNFDLLNIKQNARRLLQVVPEEVLNGMQKSMNTKAMSQLLTNLPLELAHYIDLDGKQQKLKNKLIGGSRIVLITGNEGIGKSTLAAQYAWNRKKNGCQVRWIKGNQIAEEFYRLTKDLNLEITNLYIEEIVELVYEELDRLFPKQEILFIFDDVEDKEAINPYLKNALCNGFACSYQLETIITAKNKHSFEGDKIYSAINRGGFSIIELKGFSEKEAKVYLNELIETSEEEIKEVIATVGVSPFRLSIVAAYLQNNSLKSTMEFIREYEIIKNSVKQNEKIYPEIELLLKKLKENTTKGWQLLNYFEEIFNENESLRLLKYLTYLDPRGVPLILLTKIMDLNMDELESLVSQLQKSSLIDVLTEKNQIKIRIAHGIIESEINKKFKKDTAQRAKIPKQIENALTQTNQIFNFKEGIYYLEKEATWPKKNEMYSHARDADYIYSFGTSLLTLGGEDNFKKSLEELEKALKIRCQIFEKNHRDVANSLKSIGMVYRQLGDENKYLEYIKQAYSVHFELLRANQKGTKKIKSEIELLQPNFFIAQTKQVLDCFGGNKVGSECRWIITSRGKFEKKVLEIKQKIQKSILNNIVKAIDDYGWTNVGRLFGDWGVKGYMEENFIKEKLKELDDNVENLEIAQMLCFEAMNLGIMKSEKKPYDIVQNFIQENPELVKKIAVKHPEFFVDGSIVEACIRAMPDDEIFQQHIFKHLKYMGMKARESRKEKN